MQNMILIADNCWQDKIRVYNAPYQLKRCPIWLLLIHRLVAWKSTRVNTFSLVGLAA